MICKFIVRSIKPKTPAKVRGYKKGGNILSTNTLLCLDERQNNSGKGEYMIGLPLPLGVFNSPLYYTRLLFGQRHLHLLHFAQRGV